MNANTEENSCQRSMILDDNKRMETNKKNQYIGAFAVALEILCAGTVLAWTSPALKFLLQTENVTSTVNDTAADRPGFKIDTSEEAIVGATLMIGGLLFALPSEKCADLFGRKFTLMLIAFLYLVNYVIIACANNVLMLVVARFFAGLALGGSCVVCPMYIGEIAEESLRGVLGSFISVMLTLGIVYANVIGIFANWIGLSVGLGLMPVVAATAIIFLPDTPRYLVAEERFAKAKRSLLFFRGNEKAAVTELAELKREISMVETTGTFVALFTQRRYRRPLIAGLGLFAYQQFCGINVVVFYLVPIFKAAGSTLNPLLISTTANVISLITAIVSVVVIEKRNRKYFLILSAICILIGIAGLGLFFQLTENELHFPGLQLLPISCVTLYMAGFAVGLGPIPWILLIELFTPEIRGVASGVMIVANWLAAFFVTFGYPHLMHWIGVVWTFYIYAVVNALGVIFIWFVVPETRTRPIKA